ncbi:MAG: aminoglycoside phosphotransferase family protein [Kangiellaceae bacterium]|nr:aminoglycoside phosphotransferase family protein [Kangiellaceae bacterium]
MTSSETLLPDNPSYGEACDIIDHMEDDYWFPAITRICEQHQISLQSTERVKAGGNVLFKLGNTFILKLVPPNWAYQGQAEIEAGLVISDKLSLNVPQIIAHGTVDNWVYVVMDLLPGISLADVWADLTFDNKRLIIQSIGQFMNELHQLELPTESRLRPDWQSYYQKLSDDCVPRHSRKKLPEVLVSQIEDYLTQHDADNYSVLEDLNSNESDIFIHMDLNPWNLMVEEQDSEYKISGVLDFGDAIIGRSKLLELATPLLFMCQGNAELCSLLLENYQLLDCSNSESLRTRLMAVSLLRPACDFNFVLQQVPEAGPRDNWEDIAGQLFPV